MHCPWKRKSRAWGYEVIRGIDEDDQNRVMRAFKHPTELKVVDVNSQVKQDYGGYAWTEWMHQYYGDTALHLAIKWKRHRAVKALLSLKADWKIPNEAGETAATLGSALYGQDMATLKVEQEREYEAEQMRIEEETMRRFMKAELKAREKAKQERLDEMHATRMLGVRTEAWILLEHGRVLAGESVADRECDTSWWASAAASRRWASHICDQLRRNRFSARRADIRRKESPARAPASRPPSPPRTPSKPGPSSAASDTRDECSIPARRPESRGSSPKRSAGSEDRFSSMMSPSSEGGRTRISRRSEGRGSMRSEGSLAAEPHFLPEKAPSRQAEAGQMGSSVGNSRISSPTRTTSTLTTSNASLPVGGATVKRSGPMARLRRKMQTVKRARLSALDAARQQPQPPSYLPSPVALDTTAAATPMIIGDDSRRFPRGEHASSSHHHHTAAAAVAAEESKSKYLNFDSLVEDNAEKLGDTVNRQLHVNQGIRAEGFTNKHGESFFPMIPMAHALRRSPSPGETVNDVHPSWAGEQPPKSSPGFPEITRSSAGDAPSLSRGPVVGPSAPSSSFERSSTRGGERSALDSPELIAPGAPTMAFVSGRGLERIDGTECVQRTSSPVPSPSLQKKHLEEAAVKEVLGEVKEGPFKDKLKLLLASAIDGRGKRHCPRRGKISRHHELKYCGPMAFPEARTFADVLALR